MSGSIELADGTQEDVTRDTLIAGNEAPCARWAWRWSRSRSHSSSYALGDKGRSGE